MTAASVQSTLAGAPLGVRVVVTGVRAGDAVPVRRLGELGLRPGASVRCLSRTAGGGRVVDIAGARVALGRDVLRAVGVAPTGRVDR